MARKLRILLITAFALGIGLLPHMAAYASPPQLPPLNPPPPDFETCQPTGSGTVCHGDQPIVDPPQPFGLFCGTAAQPVELIIADTGSLAARRWYNAAGNMTNRYGHLRLQGTLTDPATGLAAGFTQNDGIHSSLAIAGDLSTETEVWTGDVRFTLPGGGVLLRDVGRDVLHADGRELLSGVHQLYDYFVLGDHSVLAPLCAALGSPGTP